MARIRRHVLVTGVVQGVGFRYSARARARFLGLDGWVRNRADGAVEAEIEGDSDDVARMLEWLEEGPPDARVEAVTVAERELAPGDTGFRVTR